MATIPDFTSFGEWRGYRWGYLFAAEQRMIGLAIFCMIFMPIAGLVYRVDVWLQTSTWPEITLKSLGLEPTHFDWVGVMVIQNWFYSAPMEILAFVGAFILLKIGIWLD